jgi:hypothetical protein
LADALESLAYANKLVVRFFGSYRVHAGIADIAGLAGGQTPSRMTRSGPRRCSILGAASQSQFAR